MHPGVHRAGAPPPVGQLWLVLKSPVSLCTRTMLPGHQPPEPQTLTPAHLQRPNHRRPRSLLCTTFPQLLMSCNGKAPIVRGQFLCRNAWLVKQTISGASDPRKSPLQMNQTFQRAERPLTGRRQSGPSSATCLSTSHFKLQLITDGGDKTVPSRPV